MRINCTNKMIYAPIDSTAGLQLTKRALNTTADTATAKID